ncbi:MAG: PEP-CTERM sorting domain-containing protein [Planctomycetota bacterium]|nr:PEP-CTERM sorting domain-containing protein [Planctomycetota bacterium]
MIKTTVRFAIQSAMFAIVLAGVTSIASADFLVPNSSTAPFQSWTRGVTTNSLYAGFDVFTGAYALPNSPDNGSWPVSPAPAPLGSGVTVTQNVDGAFITTGGNIYSLGATSAFTVEIPGHDYGAGWNTRVVAQIRSLGTMIDLNSFDLAYFDGATTQTIGNVYYEERARVELGGMGGDLVDHFVVFDIAGFNAGSFLFDFKAIETSFSLDQLAIDTFTTQSALSPLPGAAIVGDLDSDGFVGQGDLNLILGNWGQTVGAGGPLQGDPSGDGSVGQDDLNQVLGGWGSGNPPITPVPEPGTLALFATGIGAVVLVRSFAGRAGILLARK